MVTSDGGGNVKKAIELLNIENLHCNDHNLNLCITDNLEIIYEIRNNKIFFKMSKTLKNVKKAINKTMDRTSI